MRLIYTQLGTGLLLNALEIGSVASRANTAILLRLKVCLYFKVFVGAMAKWNYWLLQRTHIKK